MLNTLYPKLTFNPARAAWFTGDILMLPAVLAAYNALVISYETMLSSLNTALDRGDSDMTMDLDMRVDDIQTCLESMSEVIDIMFDGAYSREIEARRRGDWDFHTSSDD